MIRIPWKRYHFVAASIFLILIITLYHGRYNPIRRYRVRPASYKEHPIWQLHHNAAHSFNDKIGRQSKSLPDAVAEYRRRYNRAPPPHFDKWFATAQNHNFVLIDEFDAIMESLEPFWSITPVLIRHRIQMVKSNADTELESGGNQEIKVVSVRNRQIVADGGMNARWSGYVLQWLESCVEYLPDMDILFNILDEPRVLASDAHSLGSNIEDGQFRFFNASHSNISERATSSCPIGSLGSSRSPTPYGAKRDPLWIETSREAQDVCSNPGLTRSHGLFLSATTLLITEDLVPIFSQSKPSPFRDILFPSAYYAENRASDEDTSRDSRFEEKDDQLYWAGSATGGYLSHGNWRDMHRQRFVSRTTLEPDRPTSLLQWDSHKKTWNQQTLTFNQTSHLFNIHMTNIVQCDDADCEEEREYFHMEAFHDRLASSRYKLNYDIDGNSFSGRFYRLLGSNSAVLKQSLLQEWHDDRLFPWLHYVPISFDMGELPETVRYLLKDDNGKRIAQWIATEGKNWSQLALRNVDLEMVFFRIVLEYARLIDDQRDSLQCCKT